MKQFERDVVSTGWFPCLTEDDMGFLDRFRNKTAEPSIDRYEIPGCSGSLTAHQEWAVAGAAAKRYGSRITGIRSTALHSQGRKATERDRHACIAWIYADIG